MKNMPRDNNAEIESVLTRSREARENFAASRLRVNHDRDEKTK